MNLFHRDGFDAALSQMPGVTFVDQWDARVSKVGGKVFCLLTDYEPRCIVYKCSEESFDILTSLDGVTQARYFAKRKWVSAEAGSSLGEDDLRAYIARSYALVAEGLTTKLRAELGIF